MISQSPKSAMAAPTLIHQPKSSVPSPGLRFHLAIARSTFGAGGPAAPQSGHWIVNVPLCTTLGRSSQNGHRFSLMPMLSLSMLTAISKFRRHSVTARGVF